MPRQEWKIQKKIRKIYTLSCSILLTTCCYFLSLFYPLQNLQHMNSLQSLLFKHCSNIEFTFLILNPKFHSFKSTGFESIIEFFWEDQTLLQQLDQGLNTLYNWLALSSSGIAVLQNLICDEFMAMEHLWLKYYLFYLVIVFHDNLSMKFALSHHHKTKLAICPR